ncbi:hypothetical protein [Solidesulfovibrio alcoholivorans]|uniref:hypothetical protein n=1 Tax=Solidesulfovibrio alcoholivorans TaxID=81406 RepID=UPI000495541B|nr:hypothetical protein [Solidesulfovibrio alcoholivorans]
METTLQQILKVQLAILAELRQLRQALAPQAAAAAPQKSTPTLETAPAPEPAPVAAPELHEPPAAAPQASSTPEPLLPLAPPLTAAGTMLTPDELADLGGQFFDPGQKPRTRTKPVVASDLSESILSDIKAKNKAKRSAFSEFEKFGRDR